MSVRIVQLTIFSTQLLLFYLSCPFQFFSLCINQQYKQYLLQGISKPPSHKIICNHASSEFILKHGIFQSPTIMRVFILYFPLIHMPKTNFTNTSKTLQRDVKIRELLFCMTEVVSYIYGYKCFYTSSKLLWIHIF